jgi:hypothetical protein
MSPPLGDSPRGGAVIGTTNRVIPFWVLQATELVSLLALADLSLHVTNGGLLVGAGALFAVLAMVADGPLGVARVCGRRLHVVLVMAASVVVALAPILPAVRPDLEGILVIELVAVGLFRLATLTSTVPPGRRSVLPPGDVVETTATVVGASSPSRTPPPPGSAAPRPPGSAARPPAASAGTAASTSAAASAGASAARWAGRAATAAAQASARHRPAAEAQVKRALRSAGRATGKVTTRSDPPEPPVG